MSIECQSSVNRVSVLIEGWSRVHASIDTRLQMPWVHVIQGFFLSYLVMVCDTKFVLISLLLIILLHFVRSAQFEHTLLITDTGVEVLTVDTEDWKLNLKQQSRVDIQGYPSEIYMRWSTIFKRHCILHNKVRIKFITNTSSVVLWPFMTASVSPVKNTQECRSKGEKLMGHRIGPLELSRHVTYFS